MPVWWNIVTSYDHILSFSETGATGPSEIALKHSMPESAEADFRCLNMGWAQSDAVLISGEIVRAERNLTGCYPQ